MWVFYLVAEFKEGHPPHLNRFGIDGFGQVDSQGKHESLKKSSPQSMFFCSLGIVNHHS